MSSTDRTVHNTHTQVNTSTRRQTVGIEFDTIRVYRLQAYQLNCNKPVSSLTRIKLHNGIKHHVFTIDNVTIL